MFVCAFNDRSIISERSSSNATNNKPDSEAKGWKLAAMIKKFNHDMKMPTQPNTAPSLQRKPRMSGHASESGKSSKKHVDPTFAELGHSIPHTANQK